MINAGTAMGYLDLDTTKFKKGIQTALTELKSFDQQASSKVTAVGSAMATVGRTMTKSVTLPLAGVGLAATKVATTFEAKMSKVQAISGATGTAFDQLNQKAIEMGAKTKFSASEAADAFSYMAMAGWDSEAMLSGIEGIMNLAAASGEDLASTSDIVTDALTAFGLQAKDSAHFADVLAQASSKSNTNVGLMGETFKYVAPVAGALGYSVEDTATAIGLMANAGIKGSQAGTALRSIMTRLVKPTDESAQAIKNLGIEVKNSDGSMKPWGETLVDLRKSFSTLTDAEKAEYAALIAGQEGMSGLLAIVNASDEDFAKLTKEINNAEGASKEMADTMMDNTAGAITLLKSALESAGVIIGKKLTPYIRALANWITRLIEKFNGLSEKQQDFIVKIGLVLAAIGPVFLIFGKLLKVIGSIGRAFKAVSDAVKIVTGALKGGSMAATALSKVFSVLTGPIGAVIAVIGVLIGAFKHLWSTNVEFRDNITNIWQKIKDTIGTFIDEIKSRFQGLQDRFKGVIDTIKAIWDGFCQLLAPIFEGAFSEIAVILDGVLGAFLGFFDIIVGLFTGDWETLWEGVKGIFSSIWGFITDTLSNFGDLLLNLVDVVLDWFGTSWESIWTSIKNFFINIWNNIVTFVTQTIPQIVKNIIQWIKDIPYNIGVLLGKAYLFFKDLGTNLWSWITNDLPQIIAGIIDWFATLPGRIWDWLVQAYNKVVSWGSNLLAKGKEVASNFVTDFISFIKELPSKVWEYIKQIPEKVTSIGTTLYEAGKSIFTDLWDGIKSVGESILGWVSDFAGKIAGFVSNIIQGFKDVVSGSDDAKRAAKSVNGSHKNGLNYVPFDGYIAELHKGERVLTKEEAQQYNQKEITPREGDTFNFYNTQPTPYEYARQMKRAKKELLYDL